MGRNPSEGLTLERKLALVISALLAAVILMFGWAAWQQMRDTSVERATERLARVAQQLAGGSEAGRARAAELRGVAATSALVQLATGAVDSASRATALARITASTPDSTAGAWQVWGTGEQQRAAFGASQRPEDAVALAVARAAAIRTATTQRSRLYTAQDTAYYWTAVPVMVNGRPAGVLAERRYLPRSERTREVIRGIIGDDVDVYFSSVGGGDWVDVSGAPTAQRFTLPDTLGGAVRLVDRAGVPTYAAAGAIASTPWVIVLAQPEAAVLRRPAEFLRRLLAIGAVLLLAGAAAAWLLGRRLARPIHDLTSAAESLAQGDYSRRVDVTGGSEVARLAATFNTMAGAIGDAHRELAARNAGLHQANEAKSRFLAMMSHELRTPLNAIGGYTEILELGLRGPVTDAQVEDLKRIRRSRDHLLSIISDILGFSRADAGHLSFNIRIVGVDEVLGETQSVLETQAREQHGVRLETVPMREPLAVRADREKLQQVVFNLVTNAIRFTDAGGLVRLEATADDGTVTIHVRDSGIGIAADKLATIFEPFVQVDASLTRRVGGTGLGLAIARELTQAMGGSIAVESVVGEGSHFTVTLPRAVPATVQPSSASAERSSAST